MRDAPFRPFDTLLDEATALATLRAATAGGGDREVFLVPKPSDIRKALHHAFRTPMRAPPFRPFDPLLDEAPALAPLRAATAGADDGELFLERKRSEALVLDDGRIKTASYDASEGFGLRAVRGEVAGYAHSTEISESALIRASETARLAVGDGGGTMAPPPKGTNIRLYGDRDPMADATFAGKIDLLKEIDAYGRSLDPRVVQVS